MKKKIRSTRTNIYLEQEKMGNCGESWSPMFWKDIWKKIERYVYISCFSNDVKFSFTFQISDSLVTNYPDVLQNSYFVQFATLRNALYMTSFVCVLGGASFLATAIFVEKDKARVDNLVRGKLYFNYL